MLGLLGSSWGPSCSCWPLGKNMGVNWLPWLGTSSWGPCGPKGPATWGFKFTTCGVSSTSGCCCCSTNWGNIEEPCRKSVCSCQRQCFCLFFNADILTFYWRRHRVSQGNKELHGNWHLISTMHTCACPIAARANAFSLRIWIYKKSRIIMTNVVSLAAQHIERL